MNRRTVISRRGFLKLGGAFTVLVAGGGVWRAADQGVFSVGKGPAYEPWDNWRTDADRGPLALVWAAILAANPHNSQPWLFRVTDTQIDLYADTSRNIGAIDPYLREMYMGVGCALENLLLAAQANGYAYQINVMPDAADSTYVARIELGPGETVASELYQAIPDRHTDRGPYDTERAVTPETLEAMSALGDDAPDATVFWFTTEAERREVGDLIVQATEAIIADRGQSDDSAKWMRLIWQDVQAHRDGITLDAAGLPGLMIAVTKMLPPLSQEQNDQFWLQATRDKQAPTAAAFGIMAVRDARDNTQRIQAGRLWQRMHLWGATQGLAMHPLNQMPERADREDRLGIEPRFGNALAELIGGSDLVLSSSALLTVNSAEGWQAAMPFRIGYPTMQALTSPRRAVQDVLL